MILTETSVVVVTAVVLCETLAAFFDQTMAIQKQKDEYRIEYVRAKCLEYIRVGFGSFRHFRGCMVHSGCYSRRYSRRYNLFQCQKASGQAHRDVSTRS